MSSDMNIQLSMVTQFPRCWASAQASSGVESPARPNYAIGSVRASCQLSAPRHFCWLKWRKCWPTIEAADVWLRLFNIFHISYFVFRIARNLMNCQWLPGPRQPPPEKPAALSASSPVSSSIIMETVKWLILSPSMSFCMRLARVYNLPR